MFVVMFSFKKRIHICRSERRRLFFSVYSRFLNNCVMHYRHRVVENGIVSPAALGAHRCKTESFSRPSRGRWRPKFGPRPYG